MIRSNEVVNLAQFFNELLYITIQSRLYLNPVGILPISIHLDVRSFDLVVEPFFISKDLAADCPIRSSQQLEQFAILITAYRSHF